jgi:hypothetical protein
MHDAETSGMVPAIVTKNVKKLIGSNQKEDHHVNLGNVVVGQMRQLYPAARAGPPIRLRQWLGPFPRAAR